MQVSKAHQRWAKVVLVVALVATVGWLWQSGLLGELTLANLKASQARLDAWVTANPVLAPAAFFVLYVLVAAASLPGAAVLTLAAGALFGLVQGTLLVSFASSLGATGAFLLARTLLRDTLRRRWPERFAAIDAGIQRDGAFYLLTLRLVPAFPFFVVNLLAGLTALATRTFYLVSQAGMLPATLAYVYAGTQLARIESPGDVLSPGLLGALGLLGVLPLLARAASRWLAARRVYRGHARPRSFDYNLVVIGAGSAGLVTSYIGAAVRARVALIEKHQMGGDCLNTGCVPSKALIRTARLLAEAKDSQRYGVERLDATFDFVRAMERVRSVVRKIEPHDSEERYRGLGVDVIRGHARVVSPWEVEVDGRRISARSLVLASGAEPLVPRLPGLESVAYLTSDTLWNLREQPRRMVVLGGGPIGCELAQTFGRFGTAVTVVELAPRLLPREDADAAELLTHRLVAEGLRVATGHEAVRVERTETGGRLICRHQGQEVALEFDQLLVALGRRARVSGFGLEELGVRLTERRTIEVDALLRTNFPNIYVAGDAAGPYQFTHVAAHQAWYAAVNALLAPFWSFAVDYRVIPWTTFTDPEIARVGLSEDEARARGIAVEVTKYGIDDLDRAIADGTDEGFVKVLTRPGTDRILGATIVGPHAAELLQEFTLAMKHGLGLNKILGTIHVYPTLSEANKYAAGVWKRARAPATALALAERLWTWRRGSGGATGVARAAGALMLLIAAALAAPLVNAQEAALQVQVQRAQDGAPIADARVAVENPSIGFRREIRTDADGRVVLNGLSTAGGYVVRAEAPGAAGTDATAATAGAAESAPLVLRSDYTHTVTLTLGATDFDGVTVSASRYVAGLNAVNAEVAASLRRDELVALPIEGRDLQQSLVRLPNVVPSTGFFPESPSISINGANALFVSWLVDGLDNNENFLGGPKFPVPVGAADSVTVLANSYSVEFGRTAYGVVNVTSRAAGNEPTAEAYVLSRPGRPYDSRSAFPRRDLSGNAVGESFERLQYGGSVGLPLVADRTFLHVNAEYTRDTNENVVDSPGLGLAGNVTGRNRFLLASARLDHVFDERWRGVLRLNRGDVTLERPGGGLGGGNATFPSAGSDQDRVSTLAAASVFYAGERLDYEGSVAYGGFDWNYGEARTTGPQVLVRDPSGLTAAVVGHPGFVFDNRERTVQTTHEVRFGRGAHRFLLGADVLSADFALRGGGNPDGNYVVDLTAAQLASLRSLGLRLDAQDVLALDPAVGSYAVELRPSEFGRRQTLASLYFEDAWSIRPDLTASLGVRWDYDSLTKQGSGDADLDNFSPRLALNWQLSADTVVRAGAGLFVDKLTYAVVSDALQRNTTSAAFRGQLAQLVASGRLPADTELERITFDGNLVVSPACATVAQCPPAGDVQQLRDTAVVNEARILNPDGYESPTSTQLSLGVQHAFATGWLASADLLYNRTRNLVRLRDVNAPTPFTPNLAALTPDNVARLRALPDDAARRALAESLGLVRSQAAADATRPIPLVPGGARQITVSETAGDAEYRALNLQLVRERFDGPWGMRFSYTRSKLTNDTDDINFRASNANDFDADEGPSANDRRHVISLVGYWYPLPGLTVTAAGLFQSGQPVNLVPDARTFGTQDLNGDGASFGENFVGNSDRYPGESRNAGRLPWAKTVDLGVRYAVPLAGGALELSFDVFNLIDANNESGFANAATTSNQVQFGGGAPFVQRNAGPPRQFQVGAAWKL